MPSNPVDEAREAEIAWHAYRSTGLTGMWLYMSLAEREHAEMSFLAGYQAAIQQERSRYEGLLHDTGIMLWFAARWIDDHDDGGARDMQESMRALGIWMFNGGIGPRPSPPASFDALKETIALAALTPSAPAEKEG